MRSVLRAALVAPVLALPTTAPAPASAQGFVEFAGTAHVQCHGCGSSTGTAVLEVAGQVNGRPVAGAASASFTVHAGPGPDCLLRGTARGSVSGAVNVSFHWTRVGNVAVISTTGEITGSGTVVVASTALGIWCGGPVEFQFGGVLGGA